MEDKTFEIMTKIYSELQGLRKDMDSKFTEVTSNLAEVNSKLDRLEKNTKEGFVATVEDFKKVSSNLREVPTEVLKLTGKVIEEQREINDIKIRMVR
jgi:uncharacterized protein YdcH (DUF465 family)